MKQEKPGLIYKATHKMTLESYIGQTRQKLNVRISAHFNAAQASRFHNDLRANPNNFEWTILENNIPGHLLEERECYWINHYNSYNKGYNQNKGGTGLSNHTKETIQKMKVKQQQKVADGTHHFVTNNPMHDPKNQEKRIKANKEWHQEKLKDGTHAFLDPEFQKRNTKAVSESNQKRLKDGTHNFIANHPLKDPKIQEKVTKVQQEKVKDGTHIFLDPEFQERKKQRAIESSNERVANRTHHFVTNNPMKNPEIVKKAQATRKANTAKKMKK